MKPLTLASVLTFAALLCMVEQADAYLYCELKGEKKWVPVRSVHLTPSVA